MTYKEKIMKERPELVDDYFVGGVIGCPGDYFEGTPGTTDKRCKLRTKGGCVKCWNTETEDKT